MSSSLLNSPTLVLNKSWFPISTTSAKNALILIYTGSAKVLDPNTYMTYNFESWSDFSDQTPSGEFIRTTSAKLLIPEVIVLERYNKIPQRLVPFTRANLYNRDSYQCQYCGVKPGIKDLSIDHVLPKSRGGLTTWENCVLACTECNKRKADKYLKNSGMKLLKDPKEPRWNPLININPRKVKMSWKNFLNHIYWNIELKD